MKAHLYYQIRRLGVIVAAHMCVEDTVFYAVKDSHHKTVMIYLCKHHFKLDDTTLARLFKMDKKYMVTKL